MISQCPTCKHRLTEFAVSCDQCGWSLVATNPSSSAPAESRKSDSRVAPADSNGTAFAKPDFESTLAHSKTLVEQQDYASALQFLNRAIISAPPERLAECYAIRGFAQLKSLAFVRAEEDCSEAIGLNWEQAQTYAWRAAARGEQNKWRLAFDDLDRACEIAGPLRDQYLSLMESYAESASDYFREQITAGKDSADLFFERGWIYLRSGKYHKAQRDFQQALTQQEKHPWASVGMAELLLLQHETDRVLEYCDAGIPGDLGCRKRALEISATLHHKSGNMSLVKNELDQLAEMVGDEPHEAVELARLRSRLGDHISAIDQLNDVLEQSSNMPLAFMLRGDCFDAIRNYALAIADYTSYLNSFPNDVKALVRRANMLLATRNWAAAQSDLSRAIEIDETDFSAHLTLSKVHLEENRLDEAMNQCRLAVSLDNQQPAAFALLASIYSRLCDYGNAIEEYSRSIEFSHVPDEQSEYRYLRGIAYYEMGDLDKALTDFNKACQDRPNHAGSWIWKAATCARMEAWPDAILGLQTAILVRPAASEQYQKLGEPVAEKAIEYYDRQQQRGFIKPELFRNRGLAKQFLDRHSGAIKDYTAALEVEPDDAETLIRRGKAFTKIRNTSAAIHDFSHVLHNDKRNHRARYCRAIAKLADGNFESAKSDLLKAIKVAPDQPRYHILLGELLQKMDNGPEVIEAFNRAILQDPTDPLTYRRRGGAHLAAGNNLQAISDFTRSLELNPIQLDLLVQRGQSYLKTNQPLMAIEDFELALTHNDRMAKAYSGRATVLVIQGRHEYALIWLTKAVHRFSDPRELSEIVFARGKVYYQMGRATPAIVDFTTTMDLMRDDRKTVAAARYARAIAEVHNKDFDAAARDFRKLLVINPESEHFLAGSKWLAHRDRPCPAFLIPPPSASRPTRPPVIRNGVAISEQTLDNLGNFPPHDAWIVRTADKKEYGPIHLQILTTWASEGRLDIGMKLLRSDWSKWKRIEKILLEITPLERFSGTIEEFPELNVGSIASRRIHED